MQELYDKLKKYSIQDSIKIEETDRQYIALKKMWDYSSIKNPDFYLSLILANSIICYQLSGKWEDYWEEFWLYFTINENIFLHLSRGNAWKAEGIIESLSNFIKKSKNNKRFIDTKVNRLEKLKPFLDEFLWNTEYYYDNMEELRDRLAKTMKQKWDAKTIVFSIKMFSYWARNVFNKLVYFPENISIPIDSRLTNLFEKYKWEYSNITKFYFDLSKKLEIPELHLDALVWVNYDELIN